MSDLLSVRKLYVDSRFLKSGTPSSFDFELPEIVELPRDTVAYITEFTAVCGWDTVNESNYKFYLVEQHSGVNRGRIVELTRQPYDSESLRAELETKLNGAGKLAGMGTYSVTRTTSAGATGSASLGAAYRYYSVSVSAGNFFMPTHADLRNPGFLSVWTAPAAQGGFDGPAFDTKAPQDTTELFNFEGSTGYLSTHVSSFIDLRSKHSLFVHSPSFGNYTSIGPNGTRTILLKVPVDSAYGSVIHHQHSGHPMDYIEVSTRGLKSLTFELRDARGNLVGLNGGHWSMTIVFAERPR